MIKKMVEPKEYMKTVKAVADCIHKCSNYAFVVGKISKGTLSTRLFEADSQVRYAEEAVEIVNNNSISDSWLVMIDLVEQGEWDVVYHLRRLLGATDIRI